MVTAVYILRLGKTCVLWGALKANRFRLKKIYLKATSFTNNNFSRMFLLHSSKGNLENMYLKLLRERMCKWDLLWNYKFRVSYLTCGQYSRDAGVRPTSESGSLVFNHVTLRELHSLWLEEGRSCGYFVTPSLWRELYLFHRVFARLLWIFYAKLLVLLLAH